MIARPSIPFGWHRVSRGTVRKGDVKLHWYVNCGLIEMRWVLGSLIPGSVIRPEHGSTAFSGISADLAPLIVEAVNQVPTLRAELLAAQSKLAALEKENAALESENVKMRELLAAAACPVSDSYGHNQTWQCQWCYERKAAIQHGAKEEKLKA